MDNMGKNPLQEIRFMSGNTIVVKGGGNGGTNVL